MRILGFLVLTLALALGSATGPGAVSAGTTAPTVYTDATGDAGAAPDLTQVTLTPGRGTVDIDLALTGALDPEAGFVILLDTDQNAHTGSNGADYYLAGSIASGVRLEKWDGAQWGDAAHAPLVMKLSGTDVVFTLTLADIGSPAAFDFLAGSVKGDDVDLVPDTGDGTYTVPVAVTMKAILLPNSVLAPKAGGVYRIPRLKVLLSDGTSLAADRQTCTLRAKGKKVPALAGGCAWRLPKSYRGVRLTLTVSVAVGGETASTNWPVYPR